MLEAPPVVLTSRAAKVLAGFQRLLFLFCWSEFWLAWARGLHILRSIIIYARMHAYFYVYMIKFATYVCICYVFVYIYIYIYKYITYTHTYKHINIQTYVYTHICCYDSCTVVWEGPRFYSTLALELNGHDTLLVQALRSEKLCVLPCCRKRLLFPFNGCSYWAEGWGHWPSHMPPYITKAVTAGYVCVYKKIYKQVCI